MRYRVFFVNPEEPTRTYHIDIETSCPPDLCKDGSLWIYGKEGAETGIPFAAYAPGIWKSFIFLGDQKSE